MELIKKQHAYITDEKHLEYLLILKKCLENYINKNFVISKKLHAKKMESRHEADKKNDIEILKNINHTIKFYSEKTTKCRIRKI